MEMKKLISAVVAFPFAAAVGAADIYHGLDRGNSDLSSSAIADVAAAQPSVGDQVDRYQGWAEGNSDLFNRGETTTVSTDDPDFYSDFGRNPDLQ
jgi:hypothetical protein